MQQSGRAQHFSLVAEAMHINRVYIETLHAHCTKTRLTAFLDFHPESIKHTKKHGTAYPNPQIFDSSYQDWLWFLYPMVTVGYGSFHTHYLHTTMVYLQAQSQDQNAGIRSQSNEELSIHRVRGNDIPGTNICTFCAHSAQYTTTATSCVYSILSIEFDER